MFWWVVSLVFNAATCFSLFILKICMFNCLSWNIYNFMKNSMLYCFCCGSLFIMSCVYSIHSSYTFRFSLFIYKSCLLKCFSWNIYFKRRTLCFTVFVIIKIQTYKLTFYTWVILTIIKKKFNILTLTQKMRKTSKSWYFLHVPTILNASSISI